MAFMPRTMPSVGSHRNCAHAAFTQVLLHFGNHVDRRRHVETFGRDSQRLINWRQVASLKLNVENGTDDLHDFADVLTVGTTFPLGVDILSLNSSSTY